MTDAHRFRLLRLSIGAAVATITLNVLAWSLSGSVGLLSDAAESVVNLVAPIVALLALRWAAKPADEGRVDEVCIYASETAASSKPGASKTPAHASVNSDYGPSRNASVSLIAHCSTRSPAASSALSTRKQQRDGAHASPT